jgi:histidinol-phosphate/aromatic aminotransferase/cobyric acid decarboxylase-like protein
VKDTLRITVGTPQENQQLLYALQLVTLWKKFYL